MELTRDNLLKCFAEGKTYTEMSQLFGIEGSVIMKKSLDFHIPTLYRVSDKEFRDAVNTYDSFEEVWRSLKFERSSTPNDYEVAVDRCEYLFYK